MEIGSFLGIAIIGAMLSLIIDVVKMSLGTSGTATKAVTLILAVVVATLFWWIQSTPYLQTVLTILGMASTVYAFFLKR